MIDEKAMGLIFRLVSALLTIMVGLTLFIAAGYASFDGKRLDIQTLGLKRRGLSAMFVGLFVMWRAVERREQ